jgi:hypothetical protein
MALDRAARPDQQFLTQGQGCTLGLAGHGQRFVLSLLLLVLQAQCAGLYHCGCVGVWCVCYTESHGYTLFVASTGSYHWF